MQLEFDLYIVGSGTVKPRREGSMTLTRMFVGGDWRAALDGAEDRAWSPATGEDLGAGDGGRTEKVMRGF
jgi:hypothetical protein